MMNTLVMKRLRRRSEFIPDIPLARKLQWKTQVQMNGQTLRHEGHEGSRYQENGGGIHLYLPSFVSFVKAFVCLQFFSAFFHSQLANAGSWHIVAQGRQGCFRDTPWLLRTGLAATRKFPVIIMLISDIS
jgi:hypothetical protein